jgi:hypothetical protein
MWTGRPKWLTHPLALGETYGEITMKSQNNSSNYDAGYYQNGTHMALMGDPSLRHHMILPPTNAVLETNTKKDQVTIKWTASTESDVIGYHLYRSQKSSGGYGSPINASLIEGTSYTDNQPYEGTNHYLVKAVKITETGSGSYTNMSIGITDSISGIKGSQSNITMIDRSKIKIYPTLVQDKIHVEQEDAQRSSFAIQNSLGVNVIEGEILSQKESINVQQLESGVYFLMLNGFSQKFVKY